MKKSILISVFIIGGILGLIASIGVYYGLALTSGEKFCVVCHEMDPMVIAYSNDVHSGKGKTGVKAQCVDCHLPHDGNIINYIYAKARNGVVEGYIHFFGDVDSIDSNDHALPRVLTVLATASPRELAVHPPSLEQLFLEQYTAEGAGR